VRCLADTDLVQLVDGSLPLEVAAHLDAHIDHCERCFKLVASLWRGNSAVQYGRNTRHADSGLGEDVTLPKAGKRYLVLALLGQGGMGQVYRAFDRLTGQTVALKRVVRRQGSQRLAPSTSAGTLQADTYAGCLGHEFRILATLRHPNIISVLDYGFDDELEPFYTMELLEGARAILPLALSLPQSARIDLLIQLLQALSYLHRRGVLHRDLKPSNLLVIPDRQGRQLLKVLDFGLSSGPEGMSLATLGGTVAYMAPELFHGTPPSVASDLYAAGMVAYEVLALGHPFAAEAGSSQLLTKVLHESPDLARLPSPFRAVLGRTLSKRPEERPRDAASLLAELCECTGMSRPHEPPAVRDSFLVAARFVGREAELQALAQALSEAHSGRGAVILLSGESGAGKSRLLDELRSIALPEGVLVLRGQSAQSGGSAYHLWRDVLRPLTLYVELEPHEAGMLSAIVSDLAALLERPVVRPAQADPQGTSFRLLRAILDVIERTAVPTLVLLEDLQWADAESLQLLARLSERIASLPILVVGSYREEEAKTLPELLPATRCLRLPRLDRQAMAELCDSILGPMENRVQLLDFVARETEGNTYFLIEWVRALAAEAGASGQLDQVATRWLSQGLLPGGVAEVLARRLMRVPTEARPTLQLAAIAGRQLDLALLSSETSQIDAVIQAAADAGVLEVQGMHWRFSHDKLRERLVSELDVPERRALHLRVARGLHDVHKDDDTRAAAIAFHYNEGGDSAGAALHYARAGEAALTRGAPGEAEGHFEHAIAHQQRIGAPRLARVHAWSGLAQARYAQGKLQETFAALQPLFTLAGVPLPTEWHQMAADLGREILRFLIRRVRGVLHIAPQPLDDEERQVLDGLRKALAVQEMFVWMAKPEMFLVCLLRGLNLEESLETPSAARHLSYGLFLLLSHTPLRPAIVKWLQHPSRRNELSGWPAVSYLRTAAMTWLNAGDAQAAAECAKAAVAAARELRDDHAIVLCLFQLQMAAGSLEDYSQVLSISQEMEDLSARMANRRYLAIGLLGQALCLMRSGEFEQAAAILDRAHDAIPPELGIMPLSLVLGQLALCALRRKDSAQAKAHADSALAALDQISWLMMPLLHPLANALEVYLSLKKPPDNHAKIRRTVARLEWIGLNFPYARPRALLYRGRYEAWLGNTLRAQIFLRCAVRFARASHLLYEEAEAHEWLSRLAAERDGNSPLSNAAETHRRTARSLYERAGAPRDAARMDVGISVKATQRNVK